MRKKALTIKADGTLPAVIEIPSQTDINQVIKDTVASPSGDWFDCVRGESFHGYVNDTGLVDGLPMNPIASILFGQVICGDVILFGSHTPEGECDIPEWVVAKARSAFMLLTTNEDARAVWV
jgi:hypothetical protein